MERKNLHTSHVNQTYEVSRKHCGKLMLAEMVLEVAEDERSEEAL